MTRLILLRVLEAASYIELSTSTLAKMRLRGDGPPFVVYDIKEAGKWLAEPTSRGICA